MAIDANPLLSSVNSGEFSPRMEARVDFERYPNAAKMCRNLLLLPQGGCTRRPGTRFIAEVADSDDATIIMPFQFSESDAWVIEAGEMYFRFYRRQAQVEIDATDTAVTNGTFTGSATGWTLGSGGASYASNRLEFDDEEFAVQDLTIAAGDQNKRHLLSFKVEGIGTMNLTITSAGATTLQEIEVPAGFHIVDFTPTDGTATLTFTSQGSSRTTGAKLYLDDVAIVEGAMELVSPYPSSDLAAMRVFQAADVAYILHQEYRPYRLERRDTYEWSLIPVDFVDGPYLGVNSLTSDTEFFDLQGRQLIDNPFFENGLEGWTDASANDGAIFHTANGAELDAGTSDASGSAALRTSFTGDNDGDDFIIRTFVLNQPVTLNVGTSAGGTQIVNGTTLKAGWTTTQISNSASTIHIEFALTDHTGERSGVAACYVYGSSARLLDASAATGSVTVTAIGFAPFASTDVGRLLRLVDPGKEPGYGIITEFSSSTSITLQVLRQVPSTATEDWAFGSFSDATGYPKSMGFFDGRLILANTPTQPQTIWASQSGFLENMQPDTFIDGLLTVEDDDAIAVTLNSKRIDPILGIGELNNLILNTGGAQWTIASSGPVITPSDIFAKVNSAVPVGDVDLVPVSQAIVFTDKSRREVYEMAFSEEQAGYIPELLTILSDHVFRSPLASMRYQRRPDSTIWCPRDDGRIATMAYNRQHQILGWSQQILGGVFGDGDAVVESIAVIPGAEDANQTYNSDERDEVWVVVKRTIAGVTKRYVEMFEYEYQGPLREDYDSESDWWAAVRTSQQDAFYVDSGITYDSTSTSTVGGLSHLEGQTVKVWADGKVHADCIVSGGQITLNTPASKVQAGLGYKHRYESLKLAVGAQAGTSVNKIKAITGCGVIVLDTATFKIASVDYNEAQGRVLHTLYPFELRMNAMTDLAEAVPLYTGEANKSLDANWSPDSRLYIESDAPGPFTLIALAPTLQGTDETQ
jgi:hypothetical protein